MWLRFLVCACAISAALGASGCNPASPPRILGGGATSIEPLINTWQPAYAAQQQVEVDYVGTGSGNGVQQTIRRAIFFGCTDVPLNAEQRESASALGGEIIHLPLVINGVVPIFRLPGVPDSASLRFTGEVLAGIFLGQITRWNDAALIQLNPNVSMPDWPIKIVSRSEPSGTTAVFAEYLARARPELWRSQNMGRGPSVAFALGIRQKGNPGVAGEVERNDGAIGYVDLAYALHLRRPVSIGEIRNGDGRFVRATPGSISAAAASATEFPDDLCFSLIDAPGASSYPICGINWAVFYRRQSAGAGKTLVDFLRWSIRSNGGQAFAAELGYAPLPSPLIDRAMKKLDSVQLD